ncbi:MAG: 2Fe-2S iron-sulfur cluster-binding protein [Pseudomonadota bacterium]
MGDAVNRTLRFLHDGDIVEIDGAAPTRTVLQWLREDRMRCGTKEGCAEGDCGACMVVVASLNGDATALDYRAINSCIQFLPTLHGKELITVEHLSPAAGPLHPVQQAMVDCHGSQCGFCTPGFVMTLFAMYKSGAPEARSDIDDATRRQPLPLHGLPPHHRRRTAYGGTRAAAGSSRAAARCGNQRCRARCHRGTPRTE